MKPIAEPMRLAAQAGEPFRRGGLFPVLAARIEAFMVRHRERLVFVHGAMLLVFVMLMLGPLAVSPLRGHEETLHHASLFLVWGFWFPLVFLSVVFAGRSWCGLLCPMGAASEWANRLGPRLAIPAWVRWPGTPILSFVLVTIWAQTAGARDHVPAMAIVFGATLAAALLLGFFYGRGKRAWCRHMCPIGLLLGVYSRIGLVDFVPKRPAPGGDRWTERTVCPTMIDLKHKTESRHCLACFRCVGPQAKGGLFLRLRWPGGEIATIRNHHGNLAEVLFLFIGTGAALGGILWLVLDSYQFIRRSVGNWAIDHGWYWFGSPGPVWLMANYPAEREVFRWLDFFLIGGYMLFWTAAMTVLMGTATAAAAWLSGRFAGNGEFHARFIELGYQFLPIAMVSLLLGLGSGLFSALGDFGIERNTIQLLKALLFLIGGAWSLLLGGQLLAGQGLAGFRRWAAMVPGALGTVAVGAAWYPAVFLT